MGIKSDIRKKYKQCPNCNTNIAIKNFLAETKKCIKCRKYHCNACSINDICIDCYIKDGQDNIISEYNNKAVVVQ